MAITPSDFSKIWASNADTPEYTFSEANYLKGWDFVGNLPPTRAQWNAIQKSTDEKMKYVFDNFGAPLMASTVAEMTLQNRVYVYTGSEAGYTAGDWYYYDAGTSTWVDGGVYNAVAIVTDTTFTQAGVPADAKATGDAIALKPNVDPTLTISGAAADAQVTGRLESNDSAKIQNLFNIIYSRNGNICDKDDLNIQGYIYGSTGTINNAPDTTNFRCGYVPLLGADTYYALLPKNVFGDFNRKHVALFRADKTFYKRLKTTVVDDNYVSFELTEEDYQNAVYVGMSYKIDEQQYAKPNIIKGTGIELPTDYYYPSWKLKNDKSMSFRSRKTIPVGGKISQIVDAGYYVVESIQNAEDLPDGYTSTNGMLQVFSPGLNDTYAIQILTSGTAEVQTYMRYVNVNNTEEYSKWNELAYVDNVTKGINILNGKVLVCDGDSICAATSDLPKKLHGWYGRFVANYGTSGHNYAVGGGTITYGLYSKSGARHYSIANNIDTIHSAYPNLDYLLLEGGTNDADLIGSFVGDTPPAKFGTWTADDFSGNYDKETFCGAVEYLFYKALSYYPHAKIGFIIAMEMGKDTVAPNNRRKYFDTIVQIAEKWHIPVLDLWKNAGADARLTSYYDSSLTTEQNVTAQKFYYDGQHPTSYGYDKMQNMIEAWVKSL